MTETDNSGTTQAVYNYGNDLISMNRSGVNSFYHYDGLGTVKQLTDSSQTVAASYTYDSFGNLIASSGSVANTYGFTGEQQFSEADSLVFLRARYYSPEIGRFIYRDPIGYRGGLNLYVYVDNDPTNYTDPEGLKKKKKTNCEDWKEQVKNCPRDPDQGDKLLLVAICHKCCAEQFSKCVKSTFNPVKWYKCYAKHDACRSACSVSGGKLGPE